MIHTFSFRREPDEYYFVWDVESGSLFNIDLPVFLLLKKRENTISESEIRQLEAMDPEMLASAGSEIDELIQGGVLDSPAREYALHGKKTDIKALCLHICHDCNLRCSYCFAQAGTYNTARDYMSVETAKAAMDFLFSHSGDRKNLEADFFGGEPLLNLDTVKAAVEYGKELAAKHGKTITFTMTTNCVLLDEETREYLNREMDNVVLSIDGRKSVHNEHRKTEAGNGSYDSVIDNAKAMAKLRGEKRYYARGTFTHDNLDFCEDVRSLSDEGFHQISVEPVVLAECSPMAIKNEDIPRIKSEYDKLANLYLDRMNTEKWFNFFHFMIDLKHGPCLQKRLTGCGAGAEYLAISPTGDVYPCHQFVGEEDYKMGNVHDGTLNREIQNTFAGITVECKDECKKCFAKYYCSGGCLANSHHFMNDLKKPYTNACEMTRKRFELSLALYALENKAKEE